MEQMSGMVSIRDTEERGCCVAEPPQFTLRGHQTTVQPQGAYSNAQVPGAIRSGVVISKSEYRRLNSAQSSV